MATNRDTNEQIRKTADAGQRAADEGARTARAVTDEAARAGEQVTRAGADVARRGAETAQDILKSSVDTAAQSVQRVTDQFAQVLGVSGPQAEEVARRSSQNLEIVSQAGTVLAKGAQEFSQQYFGLVQERLTRNMDALNRLSRCRSLQDFVAIQSDLVRDNLQHGIDTSRRVAELSLRVAEEAQRALQAKTSPDRVRQAQAA